MGQSGRVRGGLGRALGASARTRFDTPIGPCGLLEFGGGSWAPRGALYTGQLGFAFVGVGVGEASVNHLVDYGLWYLVGDRARYSTVNKGPVCAGECLQGMCAFVEVDSSALFHIVEEELAH